LGYSIPPHVCGPGLALTHYGPITINGKARIGSNCKIHVCVNIGATGLPLFNIPSSTTRSAPYIGDNVYIGHGAAVIGPIDIADNCVIGASALVNKSFLIENSVIVGNPPRVVSYKGSHSFI
jgi:serine O-acetyltransferase